MVRTRRRLHHPLHRIVCAPLAGVVTYTYRYHTGTPKHPTKKDEMAQKPDFYEEATTDYVFWNDDGTKKSIPDIERYSLEYILMRDTRLRKAGWVGLPGHFSLDEPQRKIVKAEPYSVTAMHLAHLMAFYAGKHQKVNNTPYTMYAHLDVWVNSGDEDEIENGIGEIGIDTIFTSDPEGKNNIGVSMTTYLEGDWGGLTMKEWLNLDGKTYPVGTLIWTDWGNQIEILIDPKQGK